MEREARDEQEEAKQANRAKMHTQTPLSSSRSSSYILAVFGSPLEATLAAELMDDDHMPKRVDSGPSTQAQTTVFQMCTKVIGGLIGCPVAFLDFLGMSCLFCYFCCGSDNFL